MKLIEEKDIGAEAYVRIYEINDYNEMIEYINKNWLYLSKDDIKQNTTYIIIEYHDENRPIITIKEEGGKIIYE